MGRWGSGRPPSGRQVRRGPAGDAGVEHEAGSVALAALVLMVVTLLTVVMFLGAQRSLLRGRLDTEAGRAEATAELAANEAFARIAQGETARFAGGGEVDGISFTYTAEPVDRSTWSVRAEASAGRVARALTATYSRRPLHPHTVFAVEGLNANRNAGTIVGRVGTNGTMTITGPSPGDVQELYRPDGECRGCDNPLVLDGPRRLDPVPGPSGGEAPCPVDGLFTANVDGAAGTPYRCTDPAVGVVFDGEVIVDNPPLVVLVGAGVALTLDGAVINRGGLASDVRLLVAGQPSDRQSALSATGADATALLYGPGRSLTTVDTVWTGAITLHRVDIERSGRLTVSEDPSIDSLGDDGWRVVDIRSTPSSS